MMLMYRNHIVGILPKKISLLAWGVRSPETVTSCIYSKENTPKILAGIGEGYKKVAFGAQKL